MKDPIKASLWTEVYRPTSLEETALDSETRQLLESYLEAGEIPHLLLVGPPGTGKTTVARIIYRGLDAKVLTLNASSDRGIDVVRHRIGSFVAGRSIHRWNIVFLDEADAMTSDAQTALRNLIEAHADLARFILSGNYAHKIIGAIQSRCQVITMSRPPLKERYRILARVLKAEEIEAEPPVMLAYAEKYPDLRKMLFQTQKAFFPHFRTTGERVLPPVSQEQGIAGDDILTLIEQKNHVGLRRLTASGTLDPDQALRDLFWAIPDDHPQVGFLRHVIAKGVHETTFTPDPYVLFLGVCAEAAEGLT